MRSLLQRAANLYFHHHKAMSKKKKNKQQKPETMHKVSSAFIKHAEEYFDEPDPNSTIAKIVNAVKEEQQIPRSLIKKAIEKLEDCEQTELFYAVKDGDDDYETSKSLKQMIRSPKPCRKPLALDMGMNAPSDFNRRQVPGFHF